MDRAAEQSSSFGPLYYAGFDNTAGQANEAESPHSDGHNQDVVDELLAGLSSRGRGNYSCPFDTCTKGGFCPDGQKTVFERNSDFKDISAKLMIYLSLILTL
jgi:hypothetical protein